MDLCLLPEPAHLEIFPEVAPFLISGSAAIVVSHLAEAGELNAARELQQALRALHFEAPIQARLQNTTPGRAIILATRGRDADIFPGDLAHGADSATRSASPVESTVLRWSGAVEAYTLHVTADRLEIWGAGPAGVARGVQTLRQLIATCAQSIPSLRIDDAPALAWRGVLLDVSRGRVPTLEMLFSLVDMLALQRMNMLQLYIEHTFAFPSHPKVGTGDGALTPQEILTLDAYCRDRYIELVPCLQSFGHLRGILELSEYAHLAESEERWSLAPVCEESYALLDSLYADFLPCFSSRVFNVCSDETYDLGTGQSKERAEQIGAGRLYLQHIQRLHALAAMYGRTMLVWDDIFLHHPELTAEIPRDAILLNWQYEARDHYPQVEGFSRAGLRQVVCPGTSTWNTLFPRLQNARDNIKHFAADGRRVGALGLLVTDWGDGAHYNHPGMSWYGYACGAAEAWNPGALDTERFEQRFATLTFGAEAESTQGAMRLLHQACTLPGVTRMNGTFTTDLLFGDPLAEDRTFALPDAEAWDELSDEQRCDYLLRRAACTQIADDSLERMGALATQAASLLAPLHGENGEAARTLDEFKLAARELQHAALKGRLGRMVAAAEDLSVRRALSSELDCLKRDLHELRAEHRRLWLRRSKPEGLWKSLDRFDVSAAVIDGWRAALAPRYHWNS